VSYNVSSPTSAQKNLKKAKKGVFDRFFEGNPLISLGVVLEILKIVTNNDQYIPCFL
jgi:hypothetical protein